MSGNSYSLVPIDRLKVIDCCRATIDEIKAERAIRDSKTVSDKLQSLSKFANLWPYRYWSKKPTEQDAIASLENSSWGWKSRYAWGTLDTAKALLGACEDSEAETVLVSADDWQQIQ